MCRSIEGSLSGAYQQLGIGLIKIKPISISFRQVHHLMDDALSECPSLALTLAPARAPRTRNKETRRKTEEAKIHAKEFSLDPVVYDH